MNPRKRICALLCAGLLLTASACGKAEPAAQTDPTETQSYAFDDVQTTAPADAQTSKSDTAESTQTDGAPVSEAETTEAEKAPITLAAGLNSTDVEEVLTFYKLAAAKNDVSQYTKTLTLISMDGGEGKVASHISVFEPIAAKAISKNSITNDVLPGKYKTILPTDWKSATAKKEGKYTTLHIEVVPQTDGPFGKEFEGPVGRSMTVLNGMATAVNEMPGVSADFESGKVEMQYQNPTITVKIENRTGKFVPGSCTWSYRVHPILHSLDAKVLAFKVHLQGANGYIDYVMSY